MASTMCRLHTSGSELRWQSEPPGNCEPKARVFTIVTVVYLNQLTMGNERLCFQAILGALV